MTHFEMAKDLYQQMAEGKTMDVFEKYYHDDVVIVEPTGDVRNGKAAQREAIQQWYSSVKEMHDGGVGGITASEDDTTVMVESFTDCTFQNGGRFKLEEVAVQKWEDGKIVHERFYYNVPEGMSM